MIINQTTCHHGESTAIHGLASRNITQVTGSLSIASNLQEADVGKHCDQRFLRGAIAGMLGGLAGSWTMNRFSAAIGKVEEAWKKSDHRRQPRPQSRTSSSDQAATELLAQRLSHAILGRNLTSDEMNVAEPIVHYGFGALVGGLYGLMAELTPLTTKGAGTAYATAVWLGGDEIAVPRLQLSKPAEAYPAKVHAEAFASHLIYGLTAEGVRRAVRSML